MAEPQYRDEVLLTLKNLNPPESFAFPNRRIFLTKENPILGIGRTSKRNSSLEATRNNAWFDTAVMSRDHAQFRLDAAKQKVYIEDTGSFHGTYQNETRLAANHPSSLKNGDILRFGVFIDRGSDKYPPCILEANMQFGNAIPEDPPKVFRVPDDTDIEYSSSDDDRSIGNSTNIARKIMSPWRRNSPGSSRRSLIDLTASEQLPISSIRNEPDFTSVTMLDQPSPSKCVDLTSTSQPEGEDRDCDRAITISAAGRTLLNLKTQVNDSKLSALQESDLTSPSDGESWSPSPSPTSSPSLSPSLSPSPRPTFAEALNRTRSEGHLFEWDDAADVEEIELERREDEEFDEMEELDDEVNTEEGSQVYQEHHIFSADAFADDASEPLQPRTATTVQDDPSQRAVPDSARPEACTGTMGIRSTDTITQTVGPEAYPSPLPPLEVNDVRLPAFTLNKPSSQNCMRLPSLIEATTHAGYPAPRDLPSGSLAELLGRKTGKFDFFEAMEENKAVACSSQARSRGGHSAQTPLEGSVGSDFDWSCHLPSPFASKSKEWHVSTQTGETMDANMQIRPDTLPQISPAATQTLPFGLVMTPSVETQKLPSTRPSVFDASSAFEFEQMCLAAGNASQSLSNDSQSQPSQKDDGEQGARDSLPDTALTTSIQQIPSANPVLLEKSQSHPESVENLAPAQCSLKRKADAISQLTSEEEPADNSTISIAAPPTISSQSRPRKVRFRQSKKHPSSGTSSWLGHAASAVPSPPPAKRLRRVAEVVGYAALGGVAVMSALIATAPTL